MLKRLDRFVIALTHPVIYSLLLLLIFLSYLSPLVFHAKANETSLSEGSQSQGKSFAQTNLSAKQWIVLKE